MTRPSPTPQEILAEVRGHIHEGNFGSACAMFLHLDTALQQHGPLPADWLQDTPYDPPATGSRTFKLPDLPVPETCQHWRIDNKSWKCVECQEVMRSVTFTARTILSAPNVNPCRNPEHLAAIERGESPECSVPYVAGPARTITVGADPTYECDRCQYSGPEGGIVIRADEPIVPPCGRSHRGEMVREGYVTGRPRR